MTALIKTNNMKHYVCLGGCDMESPYEGICEHKACAYHGKPFSECGCEDGLHLDLVRQARTAVKGK